MNFVVPKKMWTPSPRAFGLGAAILAIALCAVFMDCGIQPAHAAPRKDQPPAASRLKACPFTPPDADAFEKPQSQVDAENADEPDDEDEDEEDEATPGDTGSEAGPGFLIPGSGCVLIDGGVSLGTQTSVTSSNGQTLGQSLRGVTSESLLSASANLTHFRQSEFGALVTRVGIQVDASNNVTAPFASIAIGGAIFGIQPSFYDAWQASEFSFRALTASQSPALMAYTFRPSANSTLSFSFEDPSFRRATISGYGPALYPDIVGRFRYSMGPWQFIVSGALHQTSFAGTLVPLTSEGSIWGAAAQGYARYAFANKAQSDQSFVLMQFGYAYRAPGYLGINNPSSAFKISLPGTLGAQNAERAVGWNGAMSAGWAWNDKWRSAFFTSIAKLRIPETLRTGKIQSTRGAVNLTYTPVEGLDFTAEVGVAKVISRDSTIPSASQKSIIFALSRSFP